MRYFNSFGDRVPRVAQLEKSVLLEHSAREMFDLVNDVDNYPAFLPWCGGAGVKSLGAQDRIAHVEIDFHGVRHRFSTRNHIDPPHRIEMRLHDGPFSHLDGSWRFISLAENACKIEFRLHYTFSSKILEKAIGPVFSHITGSFVEAFVRRADQVYGPA